MSICLSWSQGGFLGFCWGAHVMIDSLSYLSACLSAACLIVFSLDSSLHTPGEGHCVYVFTL